MTTDLQVKSVNESATTATPEQVLATIVAGINSGDLESLMPLYESAAAFATEPGRPGSRPHRRKRGAGRSSSR